MKTGGGGILECKGGKSYRPLGREIDRIWRLTNCSYRSSTEVKEG